MLTTTKQAGDIRARWAWVKPEVWTDRMLTALENGVKGGTWYSLIDLKHSHKTTFPRLDSWIRMRLRSILRKHQGRKGHGYDHEHVRLPKPFFAQMGLFSLVTAHVEARQSPTG